MSSRDLVYFFSHLIFLKTFSFFLIKYCILNRLHRLKTFIETFFNVVLFRGKRNLRENSNHMQKIRLCESACERVRVRECVWESACERVCVWVCERVCERVRVRVFVCVPLVCVCIFSATKQVPISCREIMTDYPSLKLRRLLSTPPPLPLVSIIMYETLLNIHLDANLLYSWIFVFACKKLSCETNNHICWDFLSLIILF